MSHLNLARAATLRATLLLLCIVSTKPASGLNYKFNQSIVLRPQSIDKTVTCERQVEFVELGGTSIDVVNNFDIHNDEVIIDDFFNIIIF